MKLPFELPPPQGYSASPIWDGRQFILEGRPTPVLEYSENFMGWSDELTQLHEELTGSAHPIDVASRADALSQVRKYLPSPDATILEIGCSSGYLIRDLATAYPHATLMGADVVKAPLYQLASTLPSIPLLRFDLLQCPLPEQSIDVLIMLNVLEHIEEDVRALQNAYKLLKPGGHLIIEVPACPKLYDSYDKEVHHFRRYSVRQLRDKLTQAPFKICRQSHLGFLVFPAFLGVKRFNQWRGGTQSHNGGVSTYVPKTSKSRMVQLAMHLEQKYLSRFQLPFGIRILVTVQRQG